MALAEYLHNYTLAHERAELSRDLRDRFMDLAHEEQGADVFTTDGAVLRSMKQVLSAFCNYTELKIEQDEFLGQLDWRGEVGASLLLTQEENAALENAAAFVWRDAVHVMKKEGFAASYIGGVSQNFLVRAHALIAQAGVALGCPKGTNPEAFWLDRLYSYLLENNSDQLSFLESFPENNSEDSKKCGTIHGVCPASVMFCSWLEAQAPEQSVPSRSTEPTKKAGNHDARHAKRVEVDKREMERLLKRPSQFMQNFSSTLTDVQWKVAILRWGHQWKIARIARALGRDRSTIAETIERVGRKMNHHSQKVRNKSTEAPD